MTTKKDSKSTESFYAGIDVGAAATKSVIISETKEIIGLAIAKSGTDFFGAAKRTFDEALKESGLSKEDLSFIVATGYGRINVSFADARKTEISCHGKGAYHYFPRELTIVDIGGQDTKIIKISENGKRLGFKMNRKCAAGTGAFLDEIANRLDIPLDNLNNLAKKATKQIKLGSYCTVFTSTEILEKIRDGEKVENLIRGCFESVVRRVLEMDSLNGFVVITGGVIAHNDIILEILDKQFNIKATLPPNPQAIGALGAALYALELCG